jgi:hypothetical protein
MARSTRPPTPIGCFTENWRQNTEFTKRVVRELRRDRTLLPVLERALDRHGGKLHRILARDGFVHTVVYLRSGKPNACVIASHCRPDLQMATIIDFANVVDPQ